MYEIAGGVDDAGGGGLTALLGCPSEGSGVFVLLRLGICVGIVNDGARVAGWYTRVSVRENVERVRRDMQRERQGRLSTESHTSRDSHTRRHPDNVFHCKNICYFRSLWF